MDSNQPPRWSRRHRSTMDAPQQGRRPEALYEEAEESIEYSAAPNPKPAVLPSATDSHELREFRSKWQTELRPQRRHAPERTHSQSPALPQSSQSSSKERSSRPLVIVSQSDDESSDQESPHEGPLGYLLREHHSIEPALPGSYAYISLLPSELLLRVLSHVDVYSVEAASAVCKHWYAVARDNSLWRVFCFCIWGAMPHSAARAYARSWRNMWLQRPRLRTDGIYISKNTYFRQGVTEGSWNQTVHRVVYYRYLRFYTDGTVLAWTGPEVPRDVAEWLRTGRTAKPFSRGLWELNGNSAQLWVHSPAPVNGRRSTFSMQLVLSSTVEGRNNRLSVEQYSMQIEGQLQNALRIEISKFMFVRLPAHLL